MAGQSFTNKEFLEISKNFVPVLIDGDVEKDVTSRYGVNGFPAVKFLRANGEAVHSFVGAQPTDKVIASAQQALKAVGPIRYTKAYKKISKANKDLEKAMRKKKYSNALKAIATIEEIGHEGVALETARKHKKDIDALAQAAYDECEAIAEKDAAKAVRAFKKLQKKYKGHELADKAKARAKELDVE